MKDYVDTGIDEPNKIFDGVSHLRVQNLSVSGLNLRVKIRNDGHTGTCSVN